MADELRVAFVGCGGISNGHAACFQARPDTTLVAAVDIRADMAEKFAAKYGIDKMYISHREMLRDVQPDVVCICTWPNSYADITVAAARAGVQAVLCEKPMCVTLVEADTMILACRKSGTKLVIGHQRRFKPGVIEAKRLIAEGAIGQPTLMRSNGGGGLTNTHTHSIDGFRYLLGDPQTRWVMAQVERRSDRYERGAPIEDSCMGLICVEGGARIVIESDLPAHDQPENSYVYGTEGILDVQRASVRLLNSKSEGWQETNLESPRETAAQLDEFIAFVRGESEHRSEATCARAAMEIMIGIYESARIRGIVEFPVQTHLSPLEAMIEDGTLPVTCPGKYDIRDPWWFDEELAGDDEAIRWSVPF